METTEQAIMQKPELYIDSVTFNDEKNYRLHTAAYLYLLEQTIAGRVKY